MSLQIKQRHQFQSEKYNVELDFFMFENNHPRLLISQLEEAFKTSFADWLALSTTKKMAGFKSTCYFDQYCYAKIDDYFNDLIVEVDGQKYCSYMFAHQYIGEHNENLYNETLNFYKAIRSRC